MTPSSLPAQQGQPERTSSVLGLGDVVACASRVLAADPATLVTALDQSLAHLAAQTAAQRVYVMTVSEVDGRLTCLHKHVSDLPTAPARHSDPANTPRTWFGRGLSTFQAIEVPSLDTLPAEAAEEHLWMQQENLQSLLCLPLPSGSGCVGALALGWAQPQKSWSREDVAHLRFLAQALGVSVEHARRCGEAREARQRLGSFVTGMQAPVCCIELPAGGDAVQVSAFEWCRFRDTALVGECNAGFARLCSEEPDALRGRLLHDVEPQLLACLQPHVESLLAPPHRVEGAAMVVTRERTDTLELRAALSAVIEQGRLVRIWGTFEDVTQRRQTERERHLLEAQLRQAQRLESIGLLAGGVAHDFNNVLVAVLNYAELALRTVATNPVAAAEDLRAIIKAGNRASGLTRQLLAFSRQQPMQKQPLNLNDLVRGLMKMLRRLIHESIDLDFLPGHALGTIMADAGQIEQVLLNLIVNANDAISDIGRITIETENVVVNGNYTKTHPWARPGRYVLLSVSDTGSGMTDDVRERAFEPFFSTKSAERGSGLGLSTAYGIVKQHDGMIHLYSEPGHGSRFKIYLPIVERAASQVGGRVESVVRGGSETILVAEDNELVRQVVCTLLERAGYKVLAARDGGEAARLFDQEMENIDLALLDAVMPVMSGRAVYQHIQAQRPDLPVLFASGYTSGVFPEEFLREHQGRLLEKPYDSDTLLRRIRSALDAADAQQMP